MPHPTFLDDFLEARAVRPDVAEARKYWFIELQSYDGSRDTSWDDDPDLRKFSKGQRRPSIVIPTFGADGERNGVQLRPKHPRRDRKGKLRKYENPQGEPARRLNVHPWTVPQLSDTSIPLWVTEGIPKADSLVSHGMAAIGLISVTTWKCPDWDLIPLQDRNVFIVFDSDYALNPMVRKQQQELALFLQRRNAHVWITYLPPTDSDDPQKQGVDDWLATWPIDQRYSIDRAKDMIDMSERYVPADDEEESAQPMVFRTLGDIRATRKPLTWLVKDYWLADGFGVVGGPEKTLKSWTMLATTVAVTTGRPLFNCDRFPVNTPGKVVVLTGEGGADLTLDRIEHLCGMYGVDPSELDGRVLVTDDIANSSSQAFKDAVAEVLDTIDPVLVILDPAYVYLDGNDAGNVFNMGRKLADLRETFGHRAVMIGHHFTKNGKDDLSLSSLTQAGFREAVDHWLLMKHVSPPDLDEQRFSLGVSMGARRGFGWNATFNVTLGRFDTETLQHDGTPTWTVDEPTSDKGTDKSDVYNTLRDAGRSMTAREIAKIVYEDEDEHLKVGVHLRALRKEGLADKLPGPANKPAQWSINPLLA